MRYGRQARYTVVTVQTWGKPPELHEALVHRMAASWARRPRSQEQSEQVPRTEAQRSMSDADDQAAVDN